MPCTQFLNPSNANVNTPDTWGGDAPIGFKLNYISYITQENYNTVYRMLDIQALQFCYEQDSADMKSQYATYTSHVTYEYPIYNDAPYITVMLGGSQINSLFNNSTPDDTWMIHGTGVNAADGDTGNLSPYMGILSEIQCCMYDTTLQNVNDFRFWDSAHYRENPFTGETFDVSNMFNGESSSYWHINYTYDDANIYNNHNKIRTATGELSPFEAEPSDITQEQDQWLLIDGDENNDNLVLDLDLIEIGWSGVFNSNPNQIKIYGSNAFEQVVGDDGALGNLCIYLDPNTDTSNLCLDMINNSSIITEVLDADNSPWNLLQTFNSSTYFSNENNGSDLNAIFPPSNPTQFANFENRIHLRNRNNYRWYLLVFPGTHHEGGGVPNNLSIANLRLYGNKYATNAGCMEPLACNYDETATVDDGSCEQPALYYNCDGECIAGNGIIDCNGNCGGSWIEDPNEDCCAASSMDCAGYCNGDATQDCAGECGGTAVVDCAGTCGGEAVEDCAGECGGTAIVDECGVCDGGNASMDCNSDCSGPAVVDCVGVCDGEAEVDACGVCNGDSTSCTKYKDISGMIEYSMHYPGQIWIPHIWSYGNWTIDNDVITVKIENVNGDTEEYECNTDIDSDCVIIDVEDLSDATVYKKRIFVNIKGVQLNSNLTFESHASGLTWSHISPGGPNPIHIPSNINVNYNWPMTIYAFEYNIPGCTNTAACNYMPYPQANIDDGSCILGYDLTCYLDNDYVNTTFTPIDISDADIITAIQTYDAEFVATEGVWAPSDEGPSVSYMFYEQSEVAPINNAVLLSAPHAQRHCRETYDPPDFKQADTCTGALIKILHDLTGVPIIHTKYKADDPNYYHNLRNQPYASSGYSPASNAFDWLGGERHPYKQKITDYLDSHQNIKMVIDLHGANINNLFSVAIGTGGETSNLDGPSLNSYFGESVLNDLIIDAFSNNDLGDIWYSPGNYNGWGQNTVTEFVAASAAGYINNDDEYYQQNQSCSQPNNEPCVDSMQFEIQRSYRCGFGPDEDPVRVVKMVRSIADTIHAINSYNTYLSYWDEITNFPASDEYCSCTEISNESDLMYYDYSQITDGGGSVHEQINGCTVSTACNYDELANTDNGTCEYAEPNFDCAGNCIAVVDECDVCGGGNADMDCTGECNGTGLIDECGECNGDGIAEGACDCAGNILDCAGVCGGNAVIDACGVCGGTYPGDYLCDCTGLDGEDRIVCPPNECPGDSDNDGICDDVDDCGLESGGNGTGLYDECGCCNGDGIPDEYCGCESECGNGDWAALDLCNICGGNNSSCVDCFGVSNGNAVLDCDTVCDGTAYTDNCGNCVGGTTELDPCTLDCAGTWGGSAVSDECGVCGGDGFIQACGCGTQGDFAILDGECDCEGFNGNDPNYLDECNVCGGDGIGSYTVGYFSYYSNRPHNCTTGEPLDPIYGDFVEGCSIAFPIACSNNSCQVEYYGNSNEYPDLCYEHDNVHFFYKCIAPNCDCNENILDICGECGGTGFETYCIALDGADVGSSDLGSIEVCPSDIESTWNDQLSVNEEWVTNCINCAVDVDCEGVCNGNASFDDCDVCNGGNALMDDCGVCNGGNADKDCLDVCGGDAEELECGCNTPMPDGACDCDGNVLDDCGICNGPGKSECWDGTLVCDLSECPPEFADSGTCRCSYNETLGRCQVFENNCNAHFNPHCPYTEIRCDCTCISELITVIECNADRDCNAGYICTHNICVLDINVIDDGDIGSQCRYDLDCNRPYICNREKCSKPECQFNFDCDDDEICLGGRCKPQTPVIGCTDERACNYNPLATLMGYNACLYVTTYYLDADYDGLGCLSTAIELCPNDQLVETGLYVDNSFGSEEGKNCLCPEDIGFDSCGVCGGGNACMGCMDETALNYDSIATIQLVGSCIYIDNLESECADVYSAGILDDGCDNWCDEDGSWYNMSDLLNWLGDYLQTDDGGLDDWLLEQSTSDIDIYLSDFLASTCPSAPGICIPLSQNQITTALNEINVNWQPDILESAIEATTSCSDYDDDEQACTSVVWGDGSGGWEIDPICQYVEECDGEVLQFPSIPINAELWNFLGFTLPEPISAPFGILAAFSNTFTVGDILQGPGEDDNISTIVYNGSTWDGDFNLIPGRGYRLYSKNGGEILWSTEYTIYDVCSNEIAYNYYEDCTIHDELYNVTCEYSGGSFTENECCIGEGFSYDYYDIRYCGDESALNYNPNLTECQSTQIKSYECIYSNSNFITLNQIPYFVNELKFLLDFALLNGIVSDVFDEILTDSNEDAINLLTATSNYFTWGNGSITQITIANFENIKLPYSIGTLSGFVDLKITDSNLQTIPSSINNRLLNVDISLNILWLNNNEISIDNLNDNGVVINLSEYNTINLSNNNLTAIPDSVLQSTNNIVDLNLSSNPIEVITTDITNLGATAVYGINYLYLDDLNLQDPETPIELWQSSRVTTCSCDYCWSEISDNNVSDDWGNCLDPDGNIISTIVWTDNSTWGSDCQDKIDSGQCEACAEGYFDRFSNDDKPGQVCVNGTLVLSLNSNSGLQWSDSITQEYIMNTSYITDLSLNTNDYINMPTALPWSVTKFDVSNNQITELSQQILPNDPIVNGQWYIENLDISNNLFTDMPPELGQLPVLNYLYMSDNPELVSMNSDNFASAESQIFNTNYWDFSNTGLIELPITLMQSFKDFLLGTYTTGYPISFENFTAAGINITGSPVYCFNNAPLVFLDLLEMDCGGNSCIIGFGTGCE